MKLRILLAGVFASALALGSIAGQFDRAEAATIQWTLNNGSFDDGGAVNGSFIWDTTLHAATSWNFAVSGGDTGTFPPVTYSTGNTGHLFGDEIQPGIDVVYFCLSQVSGCDNPLRVLRFAFAHLALDTPVSALSLVSATQTGTTGYVECFNCTPVRFGVAGATFSAPSAVPLPPALALFVSGLSALGLLGWRKKRKTAAVAA